MHHINREPAKPKLGRNSVQTNLWQWYHITILTYLHVQCASLLCQQLESIFQVLCQVKEPLIYQKILWKILATLDNPLCYSVSLTQSKWGHINWMTKRREHLLRKPRFVNGKHSHPRIEWSSHSSQFSEPKWKKQLISPTRAFWQWTFLLKLWLAATRFSCWCWKSGGKVKKKHLVQLAHYGWHSQSLPPVWSTIDNSCKLGWLPAGRFHRFKLVRLLTTTLKFVILFAKFDIFGIIGSKDFYSDSRQGQFIAQLQNSQACWEVSVIGQNCIDIFA